jgi:ribonuclease P protein component
VSCEYIMRYLHVVSETASLTVGCGQRTVDQSIRVGGCWLRTVGWASSPRRSPWRHRLDLSPPDPTWESSREQAYVSAQQPTSPQDAWVSSQDAHPGRPGHPVFPAAQGPHPVGRLTATRAFDRYLRPVDDHVLPRPLRLRHSSEFLLAVKRGRRSASRTLVAHVWQPRDRSPSQVVNARAPHETPAKVGFVVGRAVGPAVTRNRVKRRLRHLMRSRADGLTRGSMCVIRALPPAASASYHELERDLDAALLNTVGDGS